MQSQNLSLKAIHTKEVRWCHEQLAHLTEPRFAAEPMPSGGCLRKIGSMDMSRDRIPFLERQRGPRRLLAIVAA